MYVYSVTRRPLANDLCTPAARNLTSAVASGSDIPGGTEACDAISAPPNGSGPGPAPEHEGPSAPISSTGTRDAASARLDISASSTDASRPSPTD